MMWVPDVVCRHERGADFFAIPEGPKGGLEKNPCFEFGYLKKINPDSLPGTGIPVVVLNLER